jgi:PRC-barrel domain
MSISNDDLGRITQQTSAVASDGDRLGTINQIYTSDTTGEPAWVTLKTGLFGTQESFVPLADASFDGDDIRVSVTKQAVHDAPRVDADGHLSVEEEDNLYRYYGLHNPGGPADDTAAAGTQNAEDVAHDGHEHDGHEHDGHEHDGHEHDGHAATVGAGTAGAAAAAAAVASPDRDDELAQRDVEGRDEVADRPDAGSAHGPEDQEAVKPGERTTQLRRYVVTERVVQTIEELPDEQG